MTEKHRRFVWCRKMMIPPRTEPLSPHELAPGLGEVREIKSDEHHIYVCSKNHDGECEFVKEDEP